MVTSKDSGGPRGLEVPKRLTGADQAQAKVCPEILREWKAGFRVSLIALEPKWRPRIRTSLQRKCDHVTTSNVIISHGLSACREKLSTIHHPRGAEAPLMLNKSYSHHHRISEVGSRPTSTSAGSLSARSVPNRSCYLFRSDDAPVFRLSA